MRQPSIALVSNITSALGPGGDNGDHSIDLTHHYQLDRPGNYFVRIARRIGVPQDIPFPRPRRRAERRRLKRPSPTLIPFTITP